MNSITAAIEMCWSVLIPQAFAVNSTNSGRSRSSGIYYVVTDALDQFDFGVELVDNKLVDGIKIGRDD